MPAVHSTSLALIVQSAPYKARIARSDLDIALAAAALDFNISIYFQGASVLQLLAQRSVSEARLPKGYRAWAALPELADTRIFAEQKWLDLCLSDGMELVLQAEALSESEMKVSWRNCDHVMVL